MTKSSAPDLVFANQEAQRLGKVLYHHWLPNMVRSLPASALRPDAFIALPKKYSLLDHFPCLNTCVMRRSLCDRAGGFWEELRYCEDLDFFLRVLDLASQIAYRHATIAIHIVPDRSVIHTGNASTALGNRDKQQMVTRVSEHILRTCTSPEVKRYAHKIGGNAYRWLALDARKTSQHKVATSYALRGLKERPTWKWAFYTGFLLVTSLIQR